MYPPALSDCRLWKTTRLTGTFWDSWTGAVLSSTAHPSTLTWSTWPLAAATGEPEDWETFQIAVSSAEWGLGPTAFSGPVVLPVLE